MRSHSGLPIFGCLALLAACDTPTESPVVETVPTFSHVAFDCSAQTSVAEVECQALVALYKSTGGDNWTDNGGWLVNSDTCQWSGIACSPGGSVTVLSLHVNQLNGSIPTKLGNLNNPARLRLDQNQLSGSIPPEKGETDGRSTSWTASSSTSRISLRRAYSARRRVIRSSRLPRS